MPFYLGLSRTGIESTLADASPDGAGQAEEYAGTHVAAGTPAAHRLVLLRHERS